MVSLAGVLHGSQGERADATAAWRAERGVLDSPAGDVRRSIRVGRESEAQVGAYRAIVMAVP